MDQTETCRAEGDPLEKKNRETGPAQATNGENAKPRAQNTETQIKKRTKQRRKNRLTRGSERATQSQDGKTKTHSTNAIQRPIFFIELKQDSYNYGGHRSPSLI
jgi:hypothetical protein